MAKSWLWVCTWWTNSPNNNIRCCNGLQAVCHIMEPCHVSHILKPNVNLSAKCEHFQSEFSEALFWVRHKVSVVHWFEIQCFLTVTQCITGFGSVGDTISQYAPLPFNEIHPSERESDWLTKNIPKIQLTFPNPFQRTKSKIDFDKRRFARSRTPTPIFPEIWRAWLHSFQWVKYPFVSSYSLLPGYLYKTTLAIDSCNMVQPKTSQPCSFFLLKC